MAANKKHMSLCMGVLTISITLLTYLLVLLFLFGCDELVRGISWLSGKAAAARGSSSSSVGKSVEDSSYDVREVVPCKQI